MKRSHSGRVMLGVALVVFFAGVLATPLVARQEAGAVDMLAGGVEGWITVRDRPAGGDEPKLDVTGGALTVLTGAAAVFYRDAAKASGDYRIEIDLTQFDPGGRNEGFGVIFGGSGLDGPSRAYTYVLLRQDGSALLKRRDGSRTPTVLSWFKHPAIKVWDQRPSGEDQISNQLVVEVRRDEVVAWANGAEILRTPREGLATDGWIGLRVNHGVHIRVERFVLRALVH